MANITLGGQAIATSGNLPNVGDKAPNFKLTASDLSTKTLEDYKGNTVVLNIFPSVDTPTCAASVKQFNTAASQLQNTKVLCVSKDLPFAQTRFCGAEGLDNVETLSDYKSSSFNDAYQVEIIEGALENLHSRCVVVINPEGVVTHTEQVSEIADEPNYEAVLKAING